MNISLQFKILLEIQTGRLKTPLIEIINFCHFFFFKKLGKIKTQVYYFCTLILKQNSKKPNNFLQCQVMFWLLLIKNRQLAIESVLPEVADNIEHFLIC